MYLQSRVQGGGQKQNMAPGYTLISNTSAHVITRNETYLTHKVYFRYTLHICVTTSNTGLKKGYIQIYIEVHMYIFIY